MRYGPWDESDVSFHAPEIWRGVDGSVRVPVTYEVINYLYDQRRRCAPR